MTKLSTKLSLVTQSKLSTKEKHRLMLFPWAHAVHGPRLWTISNQAYLLSFRFTFFYFHIFTFRNNLFTFCNRYSLFVRMRGCIKNLSFKTIVYLLWILGCSLSHGLLAVSNNTDPFLCSLLQVSVSFLHYSHFSMLTWRTFLTHGKW